MRHAFATTLLVAACATLTLAGQRPGPAPGSDPLHVPFDQILDTSVRDGLVYYRALKSERGRLDRYIASLNIPSATYDGWAADRKIAFWVNAYNAFVLETIVSSYPIHGTSSTYPASSIRQIPGAFERTKHRAAGRSVTLDEIEKTILPEFKDPRVYLALGRGSVGSGRLRSEAYTAERLKNQLADVQKEFVNEDHMFSIDRLSNQVNVTAILSWREQEFVAAYDQGASGPYAQRSPIERAIIAFVLPHLLPLEKELFQQNQFSVKFRQFDWSLNDLTGR